MHRPAGSLLDKRYQRQTTDLGDLIIEAFPERLELDPCTVSLADDRYSR